MFIRTNEVLTMGIVNIPLTKPAYVYFICDDERVKVLDVLRVLQSFKIKYSSDVMNNKKDKTVYHIKSLEKIESSIMKQIVRNFRQLRPKIETDWRYLFWEIDTKDKDVLDIVLKVYNDLDLPIYVHESMRGYHFLSVKPIMNDVFLDAISKLRPTNLDYPPLTLRIKPNKYVGELNYYNKSFIISRVYHSDTEQLKKLMLTQQLEKIAHNYYTVWYRLDGSGNKKDGGKA